MTEQRLPPGRYLTCAVDVSADYGGQTRALLMRNRIFAAHAGIRPVVLMFGPAADIAERRRALRRRGLMTPAMDLLNIYEHYRDRDLSAVAPLDQGVTDLSAHRACVEPMSDGTPFRATYELPKTGKVVHEYLRADGSPFLRVADFAFREPSSWPDRVQVISERGELVEDHPTIGHWFRSWIDHLAAPDQDTFLFMDSRYVAPHVAPIERDHIHVVYQLHNTHVGAERRWDSPLGDDYERLLGHLGDMDAFVTLTERQRADIAQRFGRRSNLFSVPNPVDLPDQPGHVERDPRLVTVVARLEAQKRLSHALRAFRRVVDRVPDARLDVYGAGSRRPNLEALATKLRLSDSVTFKGHDPSARDALWRSSAFLLTSQFEGYPLSTLESLSHGCPVVAYDITYGPREQLTDGVDGFLVEAGDVEAAADRVVELLENPDLVRRMSTAARRKAADHGADRFVADWDRVLRAVLAAKPGRTRIDEVRARVRVLGVRRGRLSRLRHRRGHDRLVMNARVRVRGTGGRSSLHDAEVTLDVVGPQGEVVTVPVRTRTSGKKVVVHCHADLRALGLLDGGTPAGAVLRLRLVWHNSGWETVIGRPADDWAAVLRR